MPTNNNDDNDSPAKKFVKGFKKATGDDSPTPDPTPSPTPQGYSVPNGDNHYADGGSTDDDSFQISKVPGMGSINQGPMPQTGDPGYDSGVAEKDPIGQMVLDSIVGFGAGKLVGKLASAMTSDAPAVAGNETGSLDLSALKRLMGNSVDDVAGAVAPNPTAGVGDTLNTNTPRPQPKAGPNADAMAQQIKNTQLMKQERYQQQLAAAKRAALASLLNK